MQSYFEKLQKLEILRATYDKKCDTEKQGFDLLAECDIKGLSYDSTSVQTSPCNQMENALIRADDKWQKKLVRIRKEKYILEKDILYLEDDISRISAILNTLSKEDMDLVVRRFKEKQSLREIGQKVHRDKESIRQDLKRIERYIRRNK